MKETIRELLAIIAAWLQGEGPLAGLFDAWWDLYVAHRDHPDQVIPYRLVD